jgi:hypothetical protein
MSPGTDVNRPLPRGDARIERHYRALLVLENLEAIQKWRDGLDERPSGGQPYLQFPWSWELHDGWGVSGMFTEFFRPSDFTTKHITETTFVLEKKLTEELSLFTEYVGDYPEGGGPSLLLNSGALYHMNRTQQVDFHIAFGLNHNGPSYIVGVGYSFRFDGLFANHPR